MLWVSKVLRCADTSLPFKNLVTNNLNVADIVIYKVTYNAGIVHHCQKRPLFLVIHIHETYFG